MTGFVTIPCNTPDNRTRDQKVLRPFLHQNVHVQHCRLQVVKCFSCSYFTFNSSTEQISVRSCYNHFIALSPRIMFLRSKRYLMDNDPAMSVRSEAFFIGFSYRNFYTGSNIPKGKMVSVHHNPEKKILFCTKMLNEIPPTV